MTIWEPGSAVGPVTDEMIEQVYSWFGCLQERRLDPAYVKAVKECHGGILRRRKFVVENEGWGIVGRFLNFYSSNFPPPGPLQPSYMDARLDKRSSWSLAKTTAIENLNIGDHLFPIAFVCMGNSGPDVLEPTHCDLICIDVLRDGAVLYWNNSESLEERFRAEEEEDWGNLNYDLYTSRIANSFTEFLDGLEIAPEDE